MPWHNLSEFIPWILAIFFVLFLIACCSWLYRCIQKCDDQCPGFLPARSPYNPNSPVTPFQSIRQTRNGEGTRRLTCRHATNDSSEPSGSFLSSASIVHYHGQKVPPYVSFSDRPPPPSYEEACISGTTPAATNSPAPGEPSVAIIDTQNIDDTENTDSARPPTPTTTERNTAAVSIPNTASSSSDMNNDAVNESVAIDNPQDEPLINDDDDDDDLTDVVIETSHSSIPATGEETTRRNSIDIYL